MRELSCVLLVAAVGCVAAFDPYVEGPYPVRHSTYWALFNADLNNMLDVFVPDTPTEVVTPIIYMVGGLGGLLPGVGYSTIHTRLASHGYTVVQPWIPGGNLVENYQGIWIDDVMAWVEAHLADKLASEGNGAGLVLDPRTIFLMSHSAGGHVAVEYNKHHCADVKGQILMSPVDGFDPFGLVDLFAITPGEYLNFAVPTLVLSAGLDNVPGTDALGGLVPPCGPEELANTRFYDAMPGNAWLLNATDYGHGDCLEDFFIWAIGATHFCASAEKDFDREAYRTFVSGEILTFLSYTLGLEDCDILQP